MKLGLLRFVYKGLLTGMPFLTYNILKQSTFNAPLDVKPYSTYLNFKLNSEQVDYLSNYINKFTNNLTIVPIELYHDTPEEYMLSVNIYNCTSPLFLNDEKEVTRCEINTYVKDNNNNYGTLIVDYLSNEISMDPVNVIKFKDNIKFQNADIYKVINCKSIMESIDLKLNFTTIYDFDNKISDKLVRYTDRVFYKNGIMDKVYYDSTLTDAEVRSPLIFNNLTFNYKGLNFTELDSIFYFTNKLNFIGGMWANIFD